MQRLAKRSLVFKLLGLAALPPLVWTALAGLVSSTLQNFKGLQTDLSRIQLSNQLAEALDLPLPLLSERELSVLAYVNYGDFPSWYLSVFTALIVVVLIPLACVLFFGPLRTVITDINQKLVTTLSVLVITSGVVFVLTLGLVIALVHEITGHSTLSGRDSRFFPRMLGEEYQTVMTRLKDLRKAPDLYLPTQYAIAQLAHRVGAEDAHRQTVAFLEAYENAPERLGFEPVPQHLYSLETAAYGAPRSAVALAYVEERKVLQGSPGIIQRLWPWLAGILSMVSTFLLLLGLSLCKRYDRLTRLSGSSPRVKAQSAVTDRRT